MGIVPTERLKLRRQMATAAGKQETVSLLLFFLEESNPEVEEELSTMATLAWSEGVCLGRWEERATEGLDETDLRSVDMEASERTCRSCRVRDPSIGHRMVTVGHFAVLRAGGGGHESGLPAKREKDASAEASQDCFTGRNGQQSTSVRSCKKECGWSRSKLYREEKQMKRGQTSTEM